MKNQITFNAKTVSCTEAIDFEIQQILFDAEEPNFDDYEDNRTTPYLLMGVNFEFSGAISVEWHDGDDYSGGVGVVEISRERNRIRLFAADEIELDITFAISDDDFKELEEYLDRILHNRSLPDPIEDIE